MPHTTDSKDPNLLKKIGFNEENVKKKLHELFIEPIYAQDGKDTPLNMTLDKYWNAEPGYVKSWIKAYIYAFQRVKMTEELTPEFISQLHQLGLEHLKHQKEYEKLINISSPGEKYSLVRPQYVKTLDGKKVEKTLESANFSKEGLQEIFKSWKEKPYLTQYISLVKNKNKNEEEKIFAIKKGKNTILHYDSPIRIAASSTDAIIDTIISSAETTSWKISLESSEDFWKDVNNNNPTINFKEAVLENLNVIITNYNDAIVQANTIDKKLDAIITFCMRFIQNQSYGAANNRTAGTLLNFLLFRNNLPLTILIAPFWMEGCSKNKCKKMVIDGMERFLALSSGQNPSFKVDKTDPLFNRIQSFNTKSVDLTSYIEESLIKDFMGYIKENFNNIRPEYFIYKEFYFLIGKMKLEENDYIKMIHFFENNEFNNLFIYAVGLKNTQPLLEFLYNNKKLLFLDFFAGSLEGFTALDVVETNTDYLVKLFVEKAYSNEKQKKNEEINKQIPKDHAEIHNKTYDLTTLYDLIEAAKNNGLSLDTCKELNNLLIDGNFPGMHFLASKHVLASDIWVCLNEQINKPSIGITNDQAPKKRPNQMSRSESTFFSKIVDLPSNENTKIYKKDNEDNEDNEKYFFDKPYGFSAK